MPQDQPAETGRGSVEVVEPTRGAQELARRVAESKATIPHAYAETEARVEDGQGPGAARALAACAKALREHPQLNGAYRDGRFELYSRVNVGFAVSVGDSLAFPVIHDADRRSEEEIADDAVRLAKRARAGTITPPELSGATFSFADPAVHGITRASGVVHRGQSAFLTLGAARERALAREGAVVAAWFAALGLAYDHRIHQSARALEFLGCVRDLIER